MLPAVGTTQQGSRWIFSQSGIRIYKWCWEFLRRLSLCATAKKWKSYEFGELFKTM